MKAQLSAFFQGQDQTPKGRNLTERVLFILQSYNNFGGASNNRFNSQTITPGFENWGSIEDIHNAIHTYVGGDGQMGSPPVSAFDPIFWLHHTNIDRLFAIWQALHEDPKVASTYVTPRPAQSGNFSIKAGATESITTPLTPFAQSGTKDRQNFWTSDGIRSTKTFGYVYPETQDWIFPQQGDIVKELNRLYQRASFANIMASTGEEFSESVKQLQTRAAAHAKAETAKPSISDQTRGQAQIDDESHGVIVQAVHDRAQIPLPRAQRTVKVSSEKRPPVAEVVEIPVTPEADEPMPDNGRDLEKLVEDNRYLEWLVNLKAEKAELGGNYVVHVFLGDPDDSTPILYVTNQSHVGAFATFGQDEDTACQNCQDGRAAGLQITGQIPLTIALVERYMAGLVDSLTPEHVIPYLRENLHWRVTMPGGQPRSREELENLLVSVVTNEVTIPSSPGGLPQYADVVVPRPEVTTNRNGVGRGNGTGYTGGQLTL